MTTLNDSTTKPVTEEEVIKAATFLTLKLVMGDPLDSKDRGALLTTLFFAIIAVRTIEDTELTRQILELADKEARILLMELLANTVKNKEEGHESK